MFDVGAFWSHSLVTPGRQTYSCDHLGQMKIRCNALVALLTDMLHLKNQELCLNDSEGGCYLGHDAAGHCETSTTLVCKALFVW